MGKPAIVIPPGPTRDELLAKGIDPGPDPTKGPWWPLLCDGAAMQSEQLPDVVEIVEGLLTERSKFIIGAGSKSYKTFFSMDLALSIATGVPFLGRQTQREPVLYVNLELKRETFVRRVQAITAAKGIQLSPGQFQQLPLRGMLSGCSIPIFVNRIIEISLYEGFKVVVLEPVYKLSTGGDENTTKDTAILFNEIDRLTTEAECTVILNDHFGKGNQAAKDPLDAIRGSSAKGGDVDAAMILRKHQIEGCFSVDVVHRELAPVDPFVIEWQYPLMQLREDLDAGDMKKPRGGRKPENDLVDLLRPIVDTAAGNPISISAWAKKAGINRQTLQGYTTTLRTKGWIATVGDGNGARQYITERGKEQL